MYSLDSFFFFRRDKSWDIEILEMQKIVRGKLTPGDKRKLEDKRRNKK